jgi:hypothetical protein
MPGGMERGMYSGVNDKRKEAGATDRKNQGQNAERLDASFNASTPHKQKQRIESIKEIRT